MNDPNSPTPLHQALAGITDPERRAWLAAWASQNQVHPHDPLWAVLAVSLMNERWSRENVDRLEAATEHLLDRINQATLRGQQRVTERAAATAQAADAAMTEAMDRLAAETAVTLRTTAGRAIREAAVGGWRGWVFPIVSACVVGVVAVFAVPMALAYAEHLRGPDEHQRYALQIGESFLSKVETMPPEDRRTVLRLLNWRDKGEAATPSNAAPEPTKSPSTPH